MTEIVLRPGDEIALRSGDRCQVIRADEDGSALREINAQVAGRTVEQRVPGSDA